MFTVQMELKCTLVNKFKDINYLPMTFTIWHIAPNIQNQVAIVETRLWVFKEIETILCENDRYYRQAQARYGLVRIQFLI